MPFDHYRWSGRQEDCVYAFSHCYTGFLATRGVLKAVEHSILRTWTNLLSLAPVWVEGFLEQRSWVESIPVPWWNPSLVSGKGHFADDHPPRGGHEQLERWIENPFFDSILKNSPISRIFDQIDRKKPGRGGGNMNKFEWNFMQTI